MILCTFVFLLTVAMNKNDGAEREIDEKKVLDEKMKNAQTESPQ